jgi:hypothetical protein
MVGRSVVEVRKMEAELLSPEGGKRKVTSGDSVSPTGRIDVTQGSDLQPIGSQGRSNIH